VSSDLDKAKTVAKASSGASATEGVALALAADAADVTLTLTNPSTTAPFRVVLKMRIFIDNLKYGIHK
jgi:cysteine synthase